MTGVFVRKLMEITVPNAAWAATTLQHWTANSLACLKDVMTCIFASLLRLFRGRILHFILKDYQKIDSIKTLQWFVWFSQLAVSDPVWQTTQMALKTTFMHKCIDRVLIASLRHSLAYEGNVEGFPPILFLMQVTNQRNLYNPCQFLKCGILSVYSWKVWFPVLCIDLYEWSGVFSLSSLQNSRRMLKWKWALPWQMSPDMLINGHFLDSNELQMFQI